MGGSQGPQHPGTAKRILFTLCHGWTTNCIKRRPFMPNHSPIPLFSPPSNQQPNHVSLHPHPCLVMIPISSRQQSMHRPHYMHQQCAPRPLQQPVPDMSSCRHDRTFHGAVPGTSKRGYLRVQQQSLDCCTGVQSKLSSYSHSCSCHHCLPSTTHDPTDLLSDLT